MMVYVLVFDDEFIDMNLWVSKYEYMNVWALSLLVYQC